MQLPKELKELITKWKKILKLEDWNFDIELKCDREYRRIEKAVGFEPGNTKGMNTSTEEQQHSLIVLNSNTDELEYYLVHELMHTIVNEINEFNITLIELQKNEEVKSFLRVRANDILEKLVWKLTQIMLKKGD